MVKKTSFFGVSSRRSCRLSKNHKVFLSDQHKEIDKNNRIGKTRDLFKKIRDTKGKFHTKMGTIRDRNGNGLNRSRRY